MPCFRDCYGELCYNNYFIKSIIIPVVAADFENNGIDGIKFLFSCFRGHDRLYNNANSPLSIFCDAIGYKYNPIQLADLVLDVEPENLDVLNFKYYSLKSYLEFSLHEMPSGILDGMNGASVSAIPDMFHIVDEFQCLSEKLSLNDGSTLIADCRKFYSAYENYLKNLDSFKNFADYLNKNDMRIMKKWQKILGVIVGVIIGILNFIIFRAIEYVYISNDLIGEDNLPLWQVSNYFMALEVLFIVTYIAGIILFIKLWRKGGSR